MDQLIHIVGRFTELTIIAHPLMSVLVLAAANVCMWARPAAILTRLYRDTTIS
jgi:hypothetical protein